MEIKTRETDIESIDYELQKELNIFHFRNIFLDFSRFYEKPILQTL